MVRLMGAVLASALACGTSRSAGQGEGPDDFTVIVGDGDDGSEEPKTASPPPSGEARPRTEDARFGFAWQLPPGWSFADARAVLPNLAGFDGTAAVALRHDKSAQALLVVVPLEGDARQVDRESALVILEKQARRKALDQGIGVRDVSRAAFAGRDAVILEGREGGKRSAEIRMILLHAERRRFELQCRQPEDTGYTCNNIFDGLTISVE